MMSATLFIKITPRSFRNAILRFDKGVLYVRVTSPPVEGAANQALIALLSESLKLRKTNITIVSGAGSRNKKVLVEGVEEDQLMLRIQECISRGN
jgi:uncharacterized protein (TIGR00251 family)